METKSSQMFRSPKPKTAPSPATRPKLGAKDPKDRESLKSRPDSPLAINPAVVPAALDPRCAQRHSLRFALASLFLSLAFFAWWFVWPLLSVRQTALWQPLAARLNQLWQGLPLWFWLSSIASFVLLLAASFFLLPADSRQTAEHSPEEGR